MSCARNDAIARFLGREGWGDAVRSALAGDASFRRYERLEGPRGRAVDVWKRRGTNDQGQVARVVHETVP